MWALSGDPDAHDPPARRPAQHHVPGPRRPAPGRGRHRRAPRAAGLPRPDRGAPHRRVRARPSVRARCSRWSAGWSGSRSCRVLLAAIHPALLLLLVGRGPAAPGRGVAAQGREAHRGGGRLPRPARPPPLHGRDLDRRPARRSASPATRPTWSRRRRTAWGSWFAPIRVTHLASAAWLSLAWAVFSLAFVAAVAWVATGLDAQPGRGGPRADRRRPALGVRRIRGRRARLPARHLARLRPAARLARGLRRRAERPRRPVRRPTGSTDGIRFEGVSFAYPGTTREVLQRRRPHRSRPAASSRSSARTAPASRPWSSCWPGCTRRRRAASPPTVSTSAASTSRSGASAWPAPSRTSPASSSSPRPPSGSATSRAATTGSRSAPPSTGPGRHRWSTTCATASTPSSGPRGTSGVDVSFGQWQKLALARGYMRPEPLLLMLDEPTAALDAETEHALFERFAAGAREADDERPGHGPGLPPVLDGADGRPDRGPRRGAGRRGRQPRGADAPGPAPTPSCTPSRPVPTPDPRPEPRAPRGRRFRA